MYQGGYVPGGNDQGGGDDRGEFNRGEMPGGGDALESRRTYGKGPLRYWERKPAAATWATLSD